MQAKKKKQKKKQCHTHVLHNPYKIQINVI